jgi:hypothetical protein
MGKMDEDDDFDDESMGIYDDRMEEETVDEFDDVEFNDDEGEEQEDDELSDEDQVDKDPDVVTTDAEVGENDPIWKPDLNIPRVGHCYICGAQAIVDELPDSISRDAFEQFGLCLNCQWGFFMDNGGHF